MIKFKMIKTGEIKTAYSATPLDDKIIIKFSEKGKEYSYFKSNIELIEDKTVVSKKPLIVYAYNDICYKCHKETEILTYIIFDDNTFESLTFPWDKIRLLKNQNIDMHMLDSSIEYYGLLTIGDYPVFDNILKAKYPDRFDEIYSQTVRRKYMMNKCKYCGAGQGKYYVYRNINEMIRDKQKIKQYDVIMIDKI